MMQFRGMRSFAALVDRLDMGSIGLLGLACLASPALASETPEIKHFSNILEIRNLSADEAGRGIPVRLEATVTYADPVFNFLFLEQAGSSIFAHALGTDELQLSGQRVLVEGKTAAGDLKPVIFADNIRLLGKGTVADPEAVALDTLTLGDGQKDAAWISVEATVEHVVIEDHKAAIWCRDRGVRFVITLGEQLTQEEASSLVGTRVRAKGNLGYLLDVGIFHRPDERRGPATFKTYRLFSQDMGHLDVLHRDGVPLPAVLSSLIPDILAGQEAAPFAVHGQITEATPSSFVLQDELAAMRFFVQPTHGLELGRVVRVIGVPRWRSNGERDFEAKVLRQLTSAPLSDPAPSLASQLAEQGQDLRRVAVRGRLLDHEQMAGHTRLLLDEAGVRFAVRLPPRKEGASYELDSALVIQTVGIFSRGVDGGSRETFEVAVVRPSDFAVVELRDAFSLLPVLISLGALLGVVGACLLWVRMLRSRVAEKTRHLSDLTAQLRSSYEAMNDGIVALDDRGEVLAVNEQARRLFGLDLQPGQGAQGMFDSIEARLDRPEALAGRLRRLRAEAELNDSFEMMLVAPEHRHLQVISTPIRLQKDGAPPIGRLWLFRDETEKRKLQASLNQSQKMEAVGTLAGGFAHDFNNLLTVVAGNLTLIRAQRGKQVGELLRELKAAEDGAHRAADLVRQLLTFSNRSDLQAKPCCMNEVAERLSSLLRHALDADIRLELALDPKLPAVLADGTLMEQVLLNLCVNARDAMPRGGRLILRSYLEPATGEGPDQVVVAVKDTGTGMPEEVQEKIFEPFFTTKRAGEGTGLGLSVSYGVVHQHGGRLECDSAPGQGTEFRVRLPVAESAVEPEVSNDFLQVSRLPATILVVDDEELVREVAEGMLSQGGFEVESVASGREALAKLDQGQGRFHAVLLDLTMPGMSGAEVLRHIRQTIPGLPVVICSGYRVGNQEGAKSIGDLSPDASLQKPYTEEQLFETLNSVLRDSASETHSPVH